MSGPDRTPAPDDERFVSLPAWTHQGMSWAADNLSDPPWEADPPDEDAEQDDITDTSRFVEHGLLGEGGMGTVHAVHDLRLERVVARKVSRNLGEANRRLAREARVLAGLEHPGIVPIYDAGTDEQGRSWYTMRRLHGATLAQVLRKKPSVEERRALVRSVAMACEAVGHAHAHGVLHRDLKPANLIVGRLGTCQVVDWGLARRMGATEPRPEGGSLHTRVGTILGTPAYMSPEQASGGEVDERSDVWSLGTVLFEVLGGRPPFVGADSASVIRAVLSAPVPDVRDLSPWVGTELSAIVHRALAREPDERYADASAMAVDLNRWLTGERVEAHDYTQLELLQRTLSAWRMPLAVAAGVLVAAFGLMGVGLWQARAAGDASRASAERALQAQAEADRALARSLALRARDALADGNRPEAEFYAIASLVRDDTPAARGVLMATGLQPRPRLLTRVPIPPGGPWRPVADGDVVVRAVGNGLEAWSVEGSELVWSLDGVVGLVAAHGDDIAVEHAGGLTLFRGRTGELSPLAGPKMSSGHLPDDLSSDRQLSVGDAISARRYDANHYLGRVESARYPLAEENLQRIALGGANGEIWGMRMDGTLVRASTEGAPLVPVTRTQLFYNHALTDMRWSRDRTKLLLAGLRGGFAVVDATSGQVVVEGTAQHGGVVGMALSPDGSRLATTGDRGGIDIWATDDGRPIAHLPGASYSAVGWNDAQQVWAMGQERVQWRVPAELPPQVFSADGVGLTDVALHPDGWVVATGGGGRDDAGLRVWDRSSGAMVWRVAAWDGVVKSLALQPEGTVLVGGMYGPITQVDLAAHTAVPFQQGWYSAGHVRRLGVLASGAVAVGTLSRAPQLVEPQPDGSWKVSCRVCQFDASIGDLEVRPGGEAFVFVDSEARVGVVKDRPDSRFEKLVDDHEAVAVGLAADGSEVYVVHRDALLALDRHTGAELRRRPLDTRVFDLAVSPDNQRLALGDLHGRVTLIDRVTFETLAITPGSTERIARLRYAADGRTLATASWDGTARLWDLSMVDRSVASLEAEIGSAWGLSLDEVLEGR